jgi:hypothetical protein
MRDPQQLVQVAYLHTVSNAVLTLRREVDCIIVADVGVSFISSIVEDPRLLRISR